jgi:hypothetical protein
MLIGCDKYVNKSFKKKMKFALKVLFFFRMLPSK